LQLIILAFLESTEPFVAKSTFYFEVATSSDALFIMVYKLKHYSYLFSQDIPSL
jgi:hypothetical protein